VSARRSRLPAAERRASVLECACRAFSRGSYRGTTTAEIAREAGVTEPILYRHFDSKRDLYLACLDESWARIRTLWERVLAEEPDPADWIAAMGQAFLESEGHRPVITNLWIEALAEASGDEEIRRRFTEHLAEVHGFVAGVIRRSQAAGGVLPERDPDAEAWAFIANGLLSIVDRRLGGVLDEAWPKIRAARRSWLTGRT
jgi:AcrR family transcriptional regulator